MVDRSVVGWVVLLLGVGCGFLVGLTTVGGIMHQSSGRSITEWCSNHHPMPLEIEFREEMRRIAKKWTDDLSELAFARQSTALQILRSKLSFLYSGLQRVVDIVFLVSDAGLSVAARHLHCSQ